MYNSPIKDSAVQISKGVCVSIIVTLIAVLIFAIVIKLFSISASIITPVNQIIKALAIFLGCIFSLRESKGWLKGAILGVVVILLTYFIFSAIAGKITFGISNLLEIAFGAIAGAISGAVAVNLRSTNS